MAYMAVTLAVGIAVVYVGLRVLVSLNNDAREPLSILNSPPFLGPILAVFLRRYKLYMQLFNQYNLPIYTLRLPFSRIYVVNETSLVLAIERQAKVLAFAPIEAAATVNLLGMSEKANKTLKWDSTSDDGHFITFHKAFRPTLSPGSGLDAMIRKSVQCLAVSLDDLRRKSSIDTTLFEWIRHEIVMATTDAEFGPDNPFRDPTFENAWYKFDPSVPLLSANFFPSVFAREGLKARELLAEGFKRYFHDGHHQAASASLHARRSHSIQAGFSDDDIARGEVGACLAILNNAVPAAFWMIYHIFSNPHILKDCKQELEAAVQLGDDFHTLDLSIVRSCCPILLSTFQEVLRFRGVGTLIIRQVVKDHYLDGKYLLKKGGIVLIPHSVQHSKPDVWGPTAGKFEHTRFVDIDTRRMKRYNPAAFRPFGAGSTLCPGRHFATAEILAFAALMILTVEIEPTRGKWPYARTDNSFGMGVARIFLLPENEIEVKISSCADQTWRVLLPVSN
ncbi:cytochrome P450 oxidoreductase [Camillea tinctor]|nr:cytochrome P450 oxidoreductase [Camillea tinctor]